MNIRNLLPASAGGLFGVLLLLPVESPSQTPPQPGKLVVTSMPKGAKIVINGKAMPQPTDATFVVSAGTYKVSVSDAAGNLKNCKTKSVPVNPGAETHLYCEATGWASEPRP